MTVETPYCALGDACITSRGARCGKRRVATIEHDGEANHVAPANSKMSMKNLAAVAHI